MQLKPIEQDFTICQIPADALSSIDFSDEFCFVSKTDEEISLVCSTLKVPDGTLNRDDGWRALRIQGVLDFSLIGILSAITALLAGEKIGIFAVSTYNTDYILTKKEDFPGALRVLEQAGYKIL